MYFAKSYNNTPKLLLHTGRQMARAISRGDADAAWRWSLIFERQLDIALKLAEIDPGDNRLRRFRPALAAMRRLVLAREQSEQSLQAAEGEAS